MRQTDYELHASRSNEPEDDLDRVLNTALAMYATVEAREGLEQRVLANLRSQKHGTPSHRWAWGLAAAVFAMALVAVVWHFRGQVRPSIANHPAPRPMPAEQVAPQKAWENVARNTAPIRRHVPTKTAPGTANPKLDQFPSPRPMSEQEKILAMYINQDPAHAALIAEARMEALRQDEKEKMDIASPDSQEIGR